MIYNGFYVKSDFVSDIYRIEKDNTLKSHYGYRCRIYSLYRGKCDRSLALVEFIDGKDIKYDGTNDEMDCIMKYIDENWEFLEHLKNGKPKNTKKPKYTVACLDVEVDENE